MIMKTLNRIYILAAALLSAAPGLLGQNFNPTVEVTNVYQGDASDIHKPQLEMAVPDSLLRFDLDFDYEVFDKAYRGAYNFSPYMLDMRPEKDAWRGRTLFLRAGAGYSLHPDAAFVFSPSLPGRFQMSVYGDHRSYFGNFADIGVHPADAAGAAILDEWGVAPWKGRDMTNRFGLEGRVKWNRMLLTTAVEYDGLSTKDNLWNRNRHDGEVRLRVTSTDPAATFYYDAGFRGRVSQDHLAEVDPSLSERSFIVDGTVGPVLDESSKVLVGFQLETRSWHRLFDDNAGRIVLNPRYELERGRWQFRLGARMDVVLPGKTVALFRPRLFSPDLHVSFNAIERHLNLYAYLTGGSAAHSWSGLTDTYHFIHPLLLTGAGPLVDNSFDKIDVGLGLRGNITPLLTFSVKGGFAASQNRPFDAVLFATSRLHPVVSFADCNRLYADLQAAWRSDRVSIEGAVQLNRTVFTGLDGDRSASLTPAIEFAPAAVRGDLRFQYWFNPRVYAGARVAASTARTGLYAEKVTDGTELRIPGWVDPGLVAGYRLSRVLGFWLESGNLLGQAIQRVPLYAEKGPWFTAGITLDF